MPRTFRCCHGTYELAVRLWAPLANPSPPLSLDLTWTGRCTRWRLERAEAARGPPPSCLISAASYQTLFWQPPPSEPVLPAGVHVRNTSPFAFFSIENV